MATFARRGRFALLVSPTMLALSLLLLMVLCERQNRQMDPYVIHPLRAERLAEVFKAVAQGSALLAGCVALGLMVWGKTGADLLAATIDGFVGLFGLLSLFFVS